MKNRNSFFGLGRKHCGKKVTSIFFSFSHNIFKSFLLKGREKSGLCCKGLKTVFVAYMYIYKTGFTSPFKIHDEDLAGLYSAANNLIETS